MTLAFSALGIFSLLFLVQQLFLSRYYGNISASSALHRELGLEMSSPVTGDTSSFLLIRWMSGASFSFLSFPPCNFSPLVHVGKHRRQRSFRQPVFILSRPGAPRLHLCLSCRSLSPSHRSRPVILSVCELRHPKVLCLKFNV